MRPKLGPAKPKQVYQGLAVIRCPILCAIQVSTQSRNVLFPAK